jgi:hypothetical protein
VTIMPANADFRNTMMILKAQAVQEETGSRPGAISCPLPAVIGSPPVCTVTFTVTVSSLSGNVSESASACDCLGDSLNCSPTVWP